LIFTNASLRGVQHDHLPRSRRDCSVAAALPELQIELSIRIVGVR
jgi:hypothetical protein